MTEIDPLRDIVARYTAKVFPPRSVETFRAWHQIGRVGDP